MNKSFLLTLLLTLNLPLFCLEAPEHVATSELTIPVNVVNPEPIQVQEPETLIQASTTAELTERALRTKPVITLVCGDLVKQVFQDPTHAAIVNAANPWLIGGAGITGAIWKASGDLTDLCDDELKDPKNTLKTELIETDRQLKIGEAVITESKNLKTNKIVDWVIHTPGPDCRKKTQNDNRKTLLTNAYLNCLKIADGIKKTDGKSIQTVTFPSISTGIFNYPFEEARDCALETVIQYLNENYATTQIKEVRFVLWDTTQFDAYFAKLIALTDQNKLSTLTNNNQFLITSSKINAPAPLAFQIK